jgi:hypothetical protein
MFKTPLIKKGGHGMRLALQNCAANKSIGKISIKLNNDKKLKRYKALTEHKITEL